MTRRNKGIAAAASVVVLSLLAGSISAYFAAKEDKANLVGIGENRIEVTEAFTQPHQSQDFSYRKLVQIQNTGSVPCYVRVRLEFSNSDVQSCAAFSAANQGETDTAPAAETFYSAVPEAADSYCAHLPDGWAYIGTPADGDPTAGYYYYTKPVAPGAATDALISWIRMQYGDTEIQAHDVFVYSESVQTVDPDTGAVYADWKAAWNQFAG